jgi:hypothetical protein
LRFSAVGAVEPAAAAPSVGLASFLGVHANNMAAAKILVLNIASLRFIIIILQKI